MFGRPPRHRPRRALLFGGLRLRWRKILEQNGCLGGRPAAIGESCHLQHPDPVERDRDDVADPDRAAGRIDANPVQSHRTPVGKAGSRSPRAHHPRVPQPLVDPLPIQAVCARLAALLCIRFELRLQGGELRERRIRVRFTLAAFRTRSRILMTRPVIRLAVAGRILTALGAALAAAAIIARRTGPLRPVVLTVVLAALLRRGIRPGCRLLRRGGAFRRSRLRACRRPLGALMLAAMMLSRRTFLAAFEAAWPPHLDQFWLRGYDRRVAGDIGRRRLRARGFACSIPGRCTF